VKADDDPLCASSSLSRLPLSPLIRLDDAPMSLTQATTIMAMVNHHKSDSQTEVPLEPFLVRWNSAMLSGLPSLDIFSSISLYN